MQLHVLFSFMLNCTSSSSIIKRHRRSLTALIDRMIEFVCVCVCVCPGDTCPGALSGDEAAAVMNRSAVLLSCDEAKSPGTDGGPCRPISVTGVSSQWAHRTQEPGTLTRPGPPCHRRVRLISGLMSASLDHFRGSGAPPASRLHFNKCMQGHRSACKERHTCSL